ncbi:MAG: c-type cytochrome domain-containing protein, partial [Verrucomicrobiales bacterium]
MKANRTLAATILLFGLQALNAAEEGAKVTFADDVFPILENKCVNCHNTDEAKGGLDLASFGATMTGGSGGAVVI